MGGKFLVLERGRVSELFDVRPELVTTGTDVYFEDRFEVAMVLFASRNVDIDPTVDGMLRKPQLLGHQFDGTM